MRWSEFRAVLSKDILEITRNPVSMILGIVVPGILMPLFMLSITDLQASLSKIDNTKHTIGFKGRSPRLEEWFKNVKGTMVFTDEAHIELKPGLNCDAAIEVPPEFDRALDMNKPGGTLKLRYNSLNDKSLLSISFIAEQLYDFKQHLIDERLKAIGILSRQEPPFKFVDLDAEVQKNHFDRNDAGCFISLLVFAMYSAASSAAAQIVTAERELNTLESLLLSPASRLTIVRAKLFLTFCVSLFCVLLTVVTFSAKYVYSGKHQLSLASVLGLEMVCLPLILILTLTVVSLTVLLSAYSRSVQQSMGYAFYLGLVLFGAAGLAFTPSVSLASPTLLIPISGMSVAIADILTGRENWLFISFSAFMGLIYCILLSKPAAGMLQSDESLYNLQVSPDQRLREGRWYQPLFFLFVGVFLSMFYAGQALLQWKAILGLIATQIVAVLSPAIIFLRCYKLPMRSTLSLNKCRPLDIAAGVMMAPFTITAATWLFELQSRYMPAPEQFFKMMNDLIMPPGTPIWQILISVALMPAVCEETLFRGVFQGLLSKRLKPVVYIPVIGLLFGFFHFSLFRFVPTATLGMLLSLLVWRTGSIFPAMALHLTHNSIGALPELQKILAELPFKLPLVMLLFCLSLAIIFFKKKTGTSGESQTGMKS